MPERLTPREIEICELLSRDLSGKEVAHALCISPETVATHRTKIMRKLDVHTATGLVRRCFELGYITLEG